MKKNTWCVCCAGVLLIVMFFSGCDMITPPTMYESSPVKIRYDLIYGYRGNCSGVGRYEIDYRCELPSVLSGTVTYSLLYPRDYQMENVSDNSFIHWNISSEDERTYQLGVTGMVTAESFLVSDLTGKNAFTVHEINELYPSLHIQYTQLQANETTRFIDPDDPTIQAYAQSIVDAAETNNSFLLAKALFSWLKQQVSYLTHPGDERVRPASETLRIRSGDCDDLSFLFISLCRSVGLPARFIRGYLITENQNDSKSAIPHAWSEVFVGGSVGNKGWVPVECACCTTSIATDIQQNFGVEDAFHLRLFIDDGSNESLQLSLSSISTVAYGAKRHISLEPFADVLRYEELESKNLLIDSKNNRYYE